MGDWNSKEGWYSDTTYYVCVLKRCKFYSQFVNNLRVDWVNLIYDIKPEHWLAEAFDWKHVTEGEEYWKEINFRWIEFLKTENISYLRDYFVITDDIPYLYDEIKLYFE